MCNKSVILVVGVHNDLLTETAKSLAKGDFLDRPESGLHPAIQFRTVCDKIVDAVTTRNQLVIATHSEAIINGVGDLIENKQCPADAIGIVVVWGEGQLQITGYSDTGALQHDWPFGFFAPVDGSIDEMVRK